MPITPRNLVKHELIGLEAEVVEAKNKNHVGIKGLVVYETKNMLWLETARGVRKIPKKGSTFLFALPDRKKVKVEGEIIAKRPEERLAIRVRKW